MPTVPFPTLSSIGAAAPASRVPSTPPLRPKAHRPILRTRSESIISLIEDPLTAQASEVFSAVSSSSPQSLPSRPSKKLYAIGDLHLSYKSNRESWDELRPHPTDGLILVGDVGESKEHCELAFSMAKSTFNTVFWCPGNHELYTLASQKDGPRGVAKYMECVELARSHGIITPGMRARASTCRSDGTNSDLLNRGSFYALGWRRRSLPNRANFHTVRLFLPARQRDSRGRIGLGERGGHSGNR